MLCTSKDLGSTPAPLKIGGDPYLYACAWEDVGTQTTNLRSRPQDCGSEELIFFSSSLLLFDLFRQAGVTW